MYLHRWISPSFFKHTYSSVRTLINNLSVIKDVFYIMKPVIQNSWLNVSYFAINYKI